MEQKRALLVDDNKIDLTTAKYFLEDIGLTVDTAKNGFEAVDKISNAEYDLFFVDLMMPQMDGFDLINRIRANILHKSTPIIIISSKTQHIDIKKALRKGIKNFIVKPVNYKTLSAKMKDLLHEYEEQKREHPLSGGLERQTAELSLKRDIKILSLSEVGMTLLTDFKVETGQTINLKSGLFAKMENSEISAEVTSYIEVNGNFYVKTRFLEINQEQRHFIRVEMVKERSYVYL